MRQQQQQEMDVFTNVVEDARQYFQGLPAAQDSSSSSTPASSRPYEHGAIAGCYTTAPKHQPTNAPTTAISRPEVADPHVAYNQGASNIRNENNTPHPPYNYWMPPNGDNIKENKNDVTENSKNNYYQQMYPTSQPHQYSRLVNNSNSQYSYPHPHPQQNHRPRQMEQPSKIHYQQSQKVPTSESLYNGYQQTSTYHLKPQSPSAPPPQQQYSQNYHSQSPVQTQTQYLSTKNESNDHMIHIQDNIQHRRTTHNLPPIAALSSVNYHSNKNNREAVQRVTSVRPRTQSYTNHISSVPTSSTSLPSSVYSTAQQPARASTIYTNNTYTNVVHQNSNSQNQYQFPVVSSPAYPSVSNSSTTSKIIYPQSSYPQYNFQKLPSTSKTEQRNSTENKINSNHGNDNKIHHENKINYAMETKQNHGIDMKPNYGTEIKPNYSSGMEMKMNHGVIHGTEIKQNHGSEIRVNYGSEMRINHGSEIKTGYGSEIKMNHGSETKINHGSEMKINYGSDVKLNHNSEIKTNHGVNHGTEMKINYGSEMKNHNSEMKMTYGSEMRNHNTDVKINYGADARNRNNSEMKIVSKEQNRNDQNQHRTDVNHGQSRSEINYVQSRNEINHNQNRNEIAYNQNHHQTNEISAAMTEAMNPKQKRESPLDLSVKTVRTSADSTALDDENTNKNIIKSRMESKIFQTQHVNGNVQQYQRNLIRTTQTSVGAPKVDFLPNFSASALQPQNYPQKDVNSMITQKIARTAAQERDAYYQKQRELHQMREQQSMLQQHPTQHQQQSYQQQSQHQQHHHIQHLPQHHSQYPQHQSQHVQQLQHHSQQSQHVPQHPQHPHQQQHQSQHQQHQHHQSHHPQSQHSYHPRQYTQVYQPQDSKPENLPRFEFPLDGNGYRKPSYPQDSRKRALEPSNDIPPKIPKVQDTWRQKMDQQIEQRLSSYANSRAQQEQLYKSQQNQQFTKPVNNVPQTKQNYVNNAQYYSQYRNQYPEPVPVYSEYQQQNNYDMYVQNNLNRSNSLSKLPTKLNNVGNQADKRILSLLRNSLESKGAKEAQKKLETVKPVNTVQSGIQHPTMDVTAPLQPKPSIHIRHNVSPFTASGLLERTSNTPPNYKYHFPRAVDSINLDTDTPDRDNTYPSEDKPQDNPTGTTTDLDGLAAFLAARIRTKAELKQVGTSQERKTEAPKLPPEQIVQPPRRKLFSKSEDDPIIPNGTLTVPPRNTTLRSSSETSVFDFPDSDSETEMPVLERQSLHDMRKDRKSKVLPVPPLDEKPQITDQTPDPEWDNICGKFCEQLQKNNGKKRGRRKKTIEPEVLAQLESVAKENPIPNLHIKQEDIEYEIKKEIEDVPEYPEYPDCSKSDIPKLDDVSEQPKDISKFLDVSQQSADVSKPISVILNNVDDLQFPPVLEIPEITIKQEKLDELEVRSEAGSDDVPLNKIKCPPVKKEENLSEDEEVALISRKTEKLGGKIRLDYSSDSDSDNINSEKLESVSRKLFTRKSKMESKDSPKMILRSADSSPVKTQATIYLKKKAIYGDGSDFHPGWEEELYRYKRSIRMPTSLITISRPHWHRMSTSLPDLDACSPAPSSLTDDTDFIPKGKFDTKIKREILDSDSNSSFCIKDEPGSSKSKKLIKKDVKDSPKDNNKISEKNNSILDVLVERYGKHKRRKNKFKLKGPKLIEKTLNPLLPTPSLGIGNNEKKIDKTKKSKTKTKDDEEKKEDAMELNNSVYLGFFRKETVATFRDTFKGIEDSFTPVLLKSRTRTETRVMKKRATIREVFGEDRPASAPPITVVEEIKDEPIETDKEDKEKVEKKDKIREGLRSSTTPTKKVYNLKKSGKSPDTKLVPKNDTKTDTKSETKTDVKVNSKSDTKLNSKSESKQIKNVLKSDAKLLDVKVLLDSSLDSKSCCSDTKTTPESKSSKSTTPEMRSRSEMDSRIFQMEFDDKISVKSETMSVTGDEAASDVSTSVPGKKRFKLRKKCSSGFDYIRKKKKIIKKENANGDDKAVKRRRGFAPRPSPESESDIQKEIKTWVMNKGVGETHLHRAARLGYTDIIAYCLEKLDYPPSPKDNAGYTPLHEACSKGHLDIARLLLLYGANVSDSAQGGIRPLHEAAENGFIEIIRLLLSYGADPMLATYSGLTPLLLTTDEETKTVLKNYMADMEALPAPPWHFNGPASFFDPENSGYNPLSDAPDPESESDMSDIEMEISDVPLPNLYRLDDEPANERWVLLQDLSTILKIKSRDTLLRQISTGPTQLSAKGLIRELKFSEFLEKAHCCQLLGGNEKINARSTKIALVKYTDKVKKLLGVEKFVVPSR